MDEPENITENQRWWLLRQINELIDPFMIFLGIIWLVLVIYELVEGLSPVLEIVSYTIWIVFIIDFAIEFIIAPSKVTYLRGNILTAISLFLPAFRIFRVIRYARFLRSLRAVRSIRLVRLLTSLNRSILSVRQYLGSRGFGYILALTILMILAGSAGILYFESPSALRADGIDVDRISSPIANYGDALWWTAMLMTTIGSDYWPQTAEGRILTFFLALYAFAIFGYITAVIASILIGRDIKQQPGLQQANFSKSQTEE